MFYGNAVKEMRKSNDHKKNGKIGVVLKSSIKAKKRSITHYRVFNEFMEADKENIIKVKSEFYI